MRTKIIEAVRNEKLIVIVRGVEKEKLIPLAQAMYDGGIRMLEITYDARKKDSDTDTARSIERLASAFEGKLLIGAGTVLTEEQVSLTKHAGGGFIISPDASATVIERTRELGMVSIPGALTPTEITTAHRSGADFVKLFPAVSMGVEYVKALRAPLPHIDLLAVGGIREGNLRDYLNAGVCGFGISSNIVNRGLIAENRFDALRELARKYVSAVKQ